VGAAAAAACCCCCCCCCCIRPPTAAPPLPFQPPRIPLPLRHSPPPPPPCRSSPEASASKAAPSTKLCSSTARKAIAAWWRHSRSSARRNRSPPPRPKQNYKPLINHQLEKKNPEKVRKILKDCFLFQFDDPLIINFLVHLFCFDDKKVKAIHRPQPALNKTPNP
jgi:hypothetical protein